MSLEYVEKKLEAQLKTSPALAAYVNGQVYPLRTPPWAELPVITYRRICGRPGADGDESTERVTIQVNVRSDDFDEAKHVAAAVRDAMYTAPFRNRLATDSDVFDEKRNCYCIRLYYTCWQKNR